MTKTALVTGGNSGIGFATAQLLVERGYAVTITGRNRARVEAAAAKLGAGALVADMADLDALAQLAAPFLDGGLDALVNNAGGGKVGPIGSFTEESFAEHINVNLRAPLFLIQLLLPALQARGGAVVNVSSVVAETAAATFAQYAAAKAGLNAASRALSIELAPLGVRINTVSPGPVETPIFGKMGVSQAESEEVQDSDFWQDGGVGSRE